MRRQYSADSPEAFMSLNKLLPFNDDIFRILPDIFASESGPAKLHSAFGTQMAYSNLDAGKISGVLAASFFIDIVPVILIFRFELVTLEFCDCRRRLVRNNSYSGFSAISSVISKHHV